MDARKEEALLGLARLGMASLPAFGGIEKLFRYQDAVGFAAAFSIPFPALTMPLAIALELGCAALLLTRRFCRPAAVVLALWTLFLGLWFHRFWAVPDDRWQDMIDSFFHHFVMVGGYIYLAVFGPGRERSV
jgi:putative oxidoreductase